MYLGRLASILLFCVQSRRVPNRLMIGFLVLCLRWSSGLPMEWERVSCLVHLEVRVGSSGSKDEKEFGKTGLLYAANFFSLTLLDQEFLESFSATERGFRQGMMDAHSSLLNSSARRPMSSKLGFVKMSRTQLSVSCGGPRCGGWEEQRTKYDLRARGLKLALWKVAARGCCSRKWARCENSEESRLQLSSLPLPVFVVATPPLGRWKPPGLSAQKAQLLHS